jgi:hypothetical protein
MKGSRNMFLEEESQAVSLKWKAQALSALFSISDSEAAQRVVASARLRYNP